MNSHDAICHIFQTPLLRLPRVNRVIARKLWLILVDSQQHEESADGVHTYWVHWRVECFDSLRWRHNDYAGVSNHQPHGCLLNRLFGRRSKKTSKLRVTGLCAANSPGPVNSPHKGPVTRKMFPFDDVIMWCSKYPGCVDAPGTTCILIVVRIGGLIWNLVLSLVVLYLHFCC